MRIKNKNNQHRKILIIAITIALLVAGAAAYFYLNRNTNSTDNSSTHSSTNLKPATNEQKDAGNQAKSSTVTNNDTSSNSAKNTPDTPVESSTNVNIQTTASAQNGSTYQLRYLINAVANDATCTLTLTNGSRAVTKTAKTQALAQSSTCQGFNISTSELSPGPWQATMTISGENITGSATSTINVQ